MSANFSDILQRLLSGSQAPMQAQQQTPASMDFGANSPPASPMPAEDDIVSPNPLQPRPTDQRMEGYRRLLTNFTYSLGSGLEAASANPRGSAQRTQAGMGAILQMPQKLKDIQDAKAIAAQQRQQVLAQTLSGIQNQQSEIQNRNAQIAETQRLRSVEEQRANQEAAHNSAMEHIAQQAADTTKTMDELKAKQYVHVGQANTADGPVELFQPPNWDGDQTKLLKVSLGAPVKSGSEKSLQSDEYVLTDGKHAVLSFDPTPTKTNPQGTYYNTTGQDVSSQVASKYHAPSGTANSADSSSYKFHVGELDKRAKPIDDAANRLGRLTDTLAQGTAQADSLVAPELMTVMAGGLGSGLRINEAEINRVTGGRPMIAQIQAKVRSWLGTDQKSAINFGAEERKAIEDLTSIVRSKLQQKQDALTETGGIISREGTTDQQRKDALAALDKKLRQIDSGSQQSSPSTPDLSGVTLDDIAKEKARRAAAKPK